MQDTHIDTKDLENFIQKTLKDKNPIAYNYALYLEEQITKMQDELQKIKPKITSEELMKFCSNTTHGDQSIANLSQTNSSQQMIKVVDKNITTTNGNINLSFGTKE